MKEMTAESALNRAAAYCSRGERCPYDVREKLRTWGVTEDAADRIVEWLKDEKFIDEARYVHAFVHDKFAYEHWGKNKILHALRAKRLDERLVRLTIEDVIEEDAEQDVLTGLLRPRWRKMEKPLSPNDRARLYRFALQRGFDAHDVGNTLRRLQTEEDDE